MRSSGRASETPYNDQRLESTMTKPRALICVPMGMRTAIFVLMIAACGGKPVPAGPGSAEPVGVVTDTRSELDKRRDVACEQVGAKITECAVADAKTELDEGRISKQEFDLNTTAEIRRKNTEEFVKACKVPLSSRQVRVLEVCFKEEQACGPLDDCLSHLNDKAAK